MSASCSCGGFTLKQKAKRAGLILRYETCGACGRTGKFVLTAHETALAHDEVARRAFNDEQLTERLLSRARAAQGAA